EVRSTNYEVRSTHQCRLAPYFVLPLWQRPRQSRILYPM
ncbi:MAG: hypothetical protein AVDCRST_MAG18-518, partial [uncultured Thermomicrobiales bacterium]